MAAKTPITQGIQKVEPVRIFEQAVDQIRNLIHNGELAPGERLPTEMELSKLLNVGRSSVREALRVLEAEGLVEVRRGSGAYVSLTPPLNNRSGDLMQWLQNREQTLEQVLEVRESIECLTASLAAKRASKAQLEKIATVLQKLSMLISPDAENEDYFSEIARLDAAFHLEISAAAGNDIASEIVNHIIPAFTQSNKAVLYLRRNAVLVCKEHEEIFQAIRDGDSQRAEKAMRLHISRVKSSIPTKDEGK